MVMKRGVDDTASEGTHPRARMWTRHEEQEGGLREGGRGAAGLAKVKLIFCMIVHAVHLVVLYEQREETVEI